MALFFCSGVFFYIILFFPPPLFITRLNLQWMLKIVMHSPCLVPCLTFCCKKMRVQALVQLLQGAVYPQLRSLWALDPMAVTCQGAEQVTPAVTTLLAFYRSWECEVWQTSLEHQVLYVKVFIIFNPHCIVLFLIFFFLLRNMKIFLLCLIYTPFKACVK